MHAPEPSIRLSGVHHRELLTRYALGQAEELEEETGCQLTVSRVFQDSRSPLYSADLAVDLTGKRVVIRELDSDEFQAVRNVFATARFWLSSNGC